MKVKFGMYWTVYGIQEVDVPSKYLNKSDEEIQEYIMSIWDDIPLPTDADYTSGSDEPDFEYFEVLKGDFDEV